VTGRPCQGRSPRRRSYRLWTLLDGVPQPGQAAVGDRGWAMMVTQSGAGRTCTTARPGGIKGSKRLDKASFQRRRNAPPMCSPGPATPTNCTPNAGEPQVIGRGAAAAARNRGRDEAGVGARGRAGAAAAAAAAAAGAWDVEGRLEQLWRQLITASCKSDRVGSPYTKRAGWRCGTYILPR